MPDTKLLNCPFCGRKPSLRKGSRYTTDGYYAWQNIKVGDWRWKPGVKCSTCKIDRDFDSVEEAVAWWNTRKPVRPSGGVAAPEGRVDGE